MNLVVVGGANIDVCAKSNAKIISRDSNIGKVDFTLGGVGRNIAEDLSLFGADVSLLTAIGNDSFGRVVIDNAHEQGVTLLAEPFEGCKTGVFAYLADGDGTFVAGINDMEIIDKITPQVIEDNINALFFADAVIVDSNLPRETIELLCSKDFKVIGDGVSSTKCLKFSGVLDKLYMIKLNRIEAFALTNTENVIDAVKFLSDKGCERGIITLGESGAMCYEKKADGIHTYWLSNLPDTEIVDTNGCGDAFLAGFVFAMMRGRNIKDSLYFGQSAAALNAESLSSVNRIMSFHGLKITGENFKEKAEAREEII
ncbi:MAG: carbohydrate kinase family protein [Sphaerochaetaceae bacterium]|nr:carbohydrate kinase family protein [Sphaerochaetaceae bacterium]